MRRLLLIVWLAAAFTANASAAPTMRRVHTADGDFILTCDAGPITADYRAQTASGAPLNGRYAREHEADHGLVALMDQGGRRVKRYVVPHSRIRAIVTVGVDQTIPDRADLVFTPQAVILAHTTTANAGIFTVSDIYRLPYGPDGEVSRAPLKDDAELKAMVDLGLSAYRPRGDRCAP